MADPKRPFHPLVRQWYRRREGGPDNFALSH